MWACSQGMSWLNLAWHYFASLFDKEPQWQTCNKSFIIFWNCGVQYPEFFKPTCWVWRCWHSISSIRRSVSSPLTNFEVFICWWNIVSNACYYFPNKMILDWEFKDAKMSRFSSDFQTLIKHWFPLYFLYELLISLRK